MFQIIKKIIHHLNVFNGGSRGRVTDFGSGGSVAEKKQRKCGLCREPGHVGTKCPMRGCR